MSYTDDRRRMVAHQLRRRGIDDERVLEAMMSVPRERFIPESQRSLAYHDGPLSIGYGQTISQPYIVAYMTEALELEPHHRVLEIGTGSGYQTALLAELSAQVYTVEVVAELADATQRLLHDLGYTNIHFEIGNGRDGWEEHAPFDRILISAAPQKFPQQLFEQLSEGGVAIAPVGDYFQKLVRYQKESGKISRRDLIGVTFVPCV